MAELADLRMRPSCRWGYVILLEGCPFGFTTHLELSESWTGTKWWDFDERKIYPGLVMPRELTTSQDSKSGQFESQSATFEITDFDGLIIPKFFGNLSKVYVSLGARLDPLQDPAPASVVDGGGNNVDLADSFIGTEAIGPELQRNYYSCTPWEVLPGQDHPAFEEPLPPITSSSVGPYLVEGRRITVLRIIYDEDLGVWPGPEEQWEAAISGNWAPAFWFGKLRTAGEVRENNIWSIDCDGPHSWLEKPLATRASATWYPVTADLTLSAEEKRIAVSFAKIFNNGDDAEINGSDDSYLVDDTDVFNSVKTAVVDISNLPGTGGFKFTDESDTGAGQINFNLNSVGISISPSYGYAGRMRLELHFRVWQFLGYSPLEDQGNLEEGRPYFEPESAEHPGCYAAYFSTTPAPLEVLIPSGEYDWAGGTTPRVYTVTYQGSVSVLSGAGGQAVHLHPTGESDTIYCEGQTIRPRTLSFINAQVTTQARWWAFRGKLQLEGQEEPEDTVQIARCSWVEDFPGSIATDGFGLTKGLVVDEWLDPRLFHMNFKPISEKLGWASRDDSEVDGAQIMAAPLSVFGAWNRRADSAVSTLLRVLVSTGTAAWDEAADDEQDGDDALVGKLAQLTEGSNSLGLDYPAGDYEIADLGLAIPAGMIDAQSFLDAASDLPEGQAGPLSSGKVAVLGPVQSQELLASLMEPRGWAWSLIRGRFGIYSPHISSELKFNESTDISITKSDLAGVAGDPASVLFSTGLRPVFPFEQLRVDYAGDPLEGFTSGQQEYQYRARDVGARARSGKVEKELHAPDLIATEWLAGDEPKKTDDIPTWTSEIRKLWEVQIPTWLARPHRLIQGLKILPHKAQDLGVGSIVRITNPWPPNSGGTYGLTNVSGRVVSITHDTASGVATIDVLAEATAPEALRWAPIVRVMDGDDPADRFDTDTLTFYCQDYGGVDAGLVLQSFIKPADLAADDEPCRVNVLGFNGVRWMLVLTAHVESVNIQAKTLTIADLTGINSAEGFLDYTFPPRMRLVIVIGADSDVEWPDLRYALHTPLGGDPDTKKLPKV